MPNITLKRVADMPKNGAGQSVISGSNWDANAVAIEGAINGGLDTSNISPTANLKGSQMADTTIPRAKADGNFELQSIMYWVNL